MTEVLCAGTLALRPAHPPLLCQGKFHPSSVTIDRRPECRIGLREHRDRAVLGWGWLGWAGLGWGLWNPGTGRPGPPANCPSAWPYSTLITEPCPAHHLGPVPARDQRDSMLLALLLLQTGQSSPINERPPCLSAQPLPLP